jgi:type II secretory pathway pseudopilin PulG
MELLCAVALIATLITVGIVLLTSSLRAIERNNWNAEAERTGRRAIALLQRDLERTVATGFYAPDRVTTNQNIAFLVFGDNEPGARTLHAVWYWLESNTNDALSLCRAIESLSPNGRIDPFANTNWHTTGHPSNSTTDIIAENIRALRFTVITNLATDPNVAQTAPSNVLPTCLDIHLETIARDTLARGETNKTKRFTARVHFANREGYRVR